MRKLKIAVAVLVGLVLVIKFVLLTAKALPEKARFALDIVALREMAGPLEACPQRAHVEKVAGMEAPEAGAVAGGRFVTVPFGFHSWLFRYADGTSVMVDPVHSKQTQDKQSAGPYDAAAWERQEAAIARASVIAVTHEHYDHLGGVTDSSHFDSFGAKLKLTAAQRTKPRFGGVDRTLTGEPTLDSGPEGSMHVVAPGVVAITSAGHTFGSQMLYVRMQTGAEFLLIGDIAWQEANLEKEKTRARVVSLIMGEDDEAIVHQLRAVLDFKKANPTVDVVVAHDIPAMERRYTSGAVTKGF